MLKDENKKYTQENLNALETFTDYLKVGEKTEEIVLKILNKKYPKAYKVEGYFKDWDLFIPELNQGVEVKQDMKSNFTGNLVIEVEMNGKKSALSTTKASWWVFYDGSEFIWTTPKLICDCIRDGDYKIVQFTGTIDTKSKKAYLIKKNHLKKFSINSKK